MIMFRCSISNRPDTIAGIYKRFLDSAENANMGPNVIGKAIGGIDNLRTILLEFEPKHILEKYKSRDEILNDVISQLIPANKKIRQAARSLWPRFCGTIISAAQFMLQFGTAVDFYQWVDFFDKDDRARPALPMLLSCEIDGLGFALSCDFLKELGYTSFGKPDVHLKKIFTELGLSTSNEDYGVLKAIVRVANHVSEAKKINVTPYNVDKLFWLIGSGKFYLNDLNVGRHRDKFIEYAKKELNA